MYIYIYICILQTRECRTPFLEPNTDERLGLFPMHHSECLLLLHPPSAQPQPGQGPTIPTRPNCSQASPNDLLLVRMSAGFFLPSIFFTRRLRSLVASCNHRNLTSRCRNLPFPNRDAIDFAAVLSTHIQMSNLHPRSSARVLSPSNSDAVFTEA